MARWNLGLRGARLKKRVGTADVSVMEINLTAEKNYDENYDNCYDSYNIIMIIILVMIIMIIHDHSHHNSSQL